MTSHLTKKADCAQDRFVSAEELKELRDAWLMCYNSYSSGITNATEMDHVMYEHEMRLIATIVGVAGAIQGTPAQLIPHISSRIQYAHQFMRLSEFMVCMDLMRMFKSIPPPLMDDSNDAAKVVDTSASATQPEQVEKTKESKKEMRERLIQQVHAVNLRDKAALKDRRKMPHSSSRWMDQEARHQKSKLILTKDTLLVLLNVLDNNTDGLLAKGKRRHFLDGVIYSLIRDKLKRRQLSLFERILADAVERHE